jgi:hypothetical protein
MLNVIGFLCWSIVTKIETRLDSALSGVNANANRIAVLDSDIRHIDQKVSKLESAIFPNLKD